MPQQLVKRARTMALSAGVLLALAAAAFGALTYVTISQTQALDQTWNALRQKAVKKQMLVSNLEAQLGYGGFIHAFKNYVLRGESKYITQFDTSLGQLRTTIAEARATQPMPAEKKALTQVEKVIEAYAGNFPIAVEMRAAGASAETVDHRVRIDDGPAIAALDQLRRAANAARQALNRRMRRVKQYRIYLWAAYGIAMLVVTGLALVLLRAARANMRRAQGLAHMQAGFEGLLEISRDGMISLTPELIITSFNEAAERMFGYRADEVCGRRIDMLLPERSRERLRRILASFTAGPEVRRELAGTRRVMGLARDGHEIPMTGAISKHRYHDDMMLSLTLHDTSEAVALERKLQESNQVALEAVRAKSRFFAIISHELRTPLNGIIGFAQAIEQEMLGPVGNPKYREYAGLIQQAGDTLQQLVNNVIDFAALETGRHQPMLQMLDPLAEARSAVAEIAAIAERKDLDCRLTGAEETASIQADQNGLSQVLLNLLGNAVKYTHAGGAVELYVAQEDDHTLFRVSDTGVGIPAQSLYEVTEPFAQAGHGDPLTAGRTTDGPGLGLAIVREIVEAHGGLLHIESEVNVGTVVTVMFPNAPPVPGQLSMAEARARSRNHAANADTSG